MNAVDRVMTRPAGEQLLVGDHTAAGERNRELDDRPSTFGQP